MYHLQRARPLEALPPTHGRLVTVWDGVSIEEKIHTESKDDLCVPQSCMGYTKYTICWALLQYWRLAQANNVSCKTPEAIILLSWAMTAVLPSLIQLNHMQFFPKGFSIGLFICDVGVHTAAGLIGLAAPFLCALIQSCYARPCPILFPISGTPTPTPSLSSLPAYTHFQHT